MTKLRFKEHQLIGDKVQGIGDECEVEDEGFVKFLIASNKAEAIDDFTVNKEKVKAMAKNESSIENKLATGEKTQPVGNVSPNLVKANK